MSSRRHIRHEITEKGLDHGKPHTLFKSNLDIRDPVIIVSEPVTVEPTVAAAPPVIERPIIPDPIQPTETSVEIEVKPETVEGVQEKIEEPVSVTPIETGPAVDTATEKKKQQPKRKAKAGAPSADQ